MSIHANKQIAYKGQRNRWVVEDGTQREGWQMTFGERSRLPGGRLTQRCQLVGAIAAYGQPLLFCQSLTLLSWWVDYHPDSA